MSLADIAAFMQEIELGLGLEKRRGVDRLRLLAMRMQSIPQKDVGSSKVNDFLQLWPDIEVCRRFPKVLKSLCSCRIIKKDSHAYSFCCCSFHLPAFASLRAVCRAAPDIAHQICRAYFSRLSSPVIYPVLRWTNICNRTACHPALLLRSRLVRVLLVSISTKSPNYSLRNPRRLSPNHRTIQRSRHWSRMK